MKTRRAQRISFARSGAALVVALCAACVLVEPPGELPPLIEQRPLILHQFVVPPTTQILESWPVGGFFVPIQVPDPTATVQFHAFVDYDPIAPTTPQTGLLSPDANQDGGIRDLDLIVDVPNDLTACHTIELLVANSFVENHTPDAVGGDSATWFYAPGGSLARCPVFDAGLIDAGVGEGGVDGASP
jgi:hypothetical protein